MLSVAICILLILHVQCMLIFFIVYNLRIAMEIIMNGETIMGENVISILRQGENSLQIVQCHHQKTKHAYVSLHVRVQVH